ncbi:MAG TPA: ABC transporter ATP-binding protein [Elusimicrobiota bacterium]|nr:ABC transporter ATP-binding protein [Elusimicrobiota bacterium]
MATAIKTSQLHKTFGEVPVLRRLDLEIPEGEFVCIVGPSGAGKSTLLHIMGLMTPPTSGTLSLFGTDTDGLPDGKLSDMRNRWIGFLFQFHHLLPDLTLWENVAVPLLLRREPMKEARSKAENLLKQLGLGHRLDHRPSETSGGEQQRTAMARALIGEPRLLLADEPTGNLDHKTGEEIQKILREETRRRHTTVVTVTHNEALAAQADRTFHMVDGTLTDSI